MLSASLTAKLLQEIQLWAVVPKQVAHVLWQVIMLQFPDKSIEYPLLQTQSPDETLTALALHVIH